MYSKKGFQVYKKYWEDQASFMDQSPWHLKKVLKLTISNDFNRDIEKLEFSKHSISRAQGQLTLRVNVPHNYFELDGFELKALELLGIEKDWLTDMNLEGSNCTLQINKEK